MNKSGAILQRFHNLPKTQVSGSVGQATRLRYNGVTPMQVMAQVF